MPTIDLTDDEHAAVTAAIRRAIETDRFPRAPRLDPVRSALAKLDPMRMEAYSAQAQEFVASIHEGRRPSATGEDGRAAVEIALAAYRSAKEQCTVILK